MKPFFVYMLRCRDGSYYVGHTDDLERRVIEHQHGAIPGHTSTRRPVALVWSAEMATRDEALEREMQIKRWVRSKKEALIREDWGRVKRLARGRDRSRSPFDSGPAESGPKRRGGPYAQGERGGAQPGGEGERAVGAAQSGGEGEGVGAAQPVSEPQDA